MSSEWIQLQIQDFGRIVTGKTPTTARADYFDGPVPFLTPTDMVDGQKSVTASRSLTAAGLASVKNCLVPKGVAVSCIGWQMGKSVLVSQPTVTNQQINTVVVDESRFDLSFVYYLLSSMRKRIFELGATPTRTPIVNKSTFGQMHVSVPPLNEQKLISDFLTVIDSRIALLRETNATLEAIAQALFKSWFVNFDPTHARARGEEPAGLAPEVAALFPDSFEESELGLVPKGWLSTMLGDVCKFQKGCSYKGAGLSEDSGAYMFNLGCFNAPRIFAFENIKRYTGDYKPRHEVVAGELIVANTDMTQMRDILGRPLIVPSGYEKAFISHHVFRVEFPSLEDQKLLRNFLFFAFGLPEFRERAVGFATGTTVLGLPKDALDGYQMVVPAKEVLAAFNEVCEPILAQIEANHHKSQTLATLRDALLSRLISGQLRLPEAEAALQEAGI